MRHDSIRGDLRTLVAAGIAVAVMFGCTIPVRAQVDDLDDHYIDFAVPDVSAYTLLGIEASRISRPGNVRDLFVATASEIGRSGAFEQGVGLELAPLFLIVNPRTLQDYRPLRDRLTLSIAAIRGEDVERMGLGFRWVLIDRADPYQDAELGRNIRSALRTAIASGLTARMRVEFDDRADALLAPLQPDEEARVALLDLIDLTALDDAPDPLTPEAVGDRLQEGLGQQGRMLTSEERAGLEVLAAEYVRLARIGLGTDVDAELSRLIVDRKRAFRDRTWNALAFQIAGGLTTRTSTGLDDLRLDEFNLFAGITLPVLPRRGQLIGHLQLGVPLDDTGEDLRGTIGARLLLGDATRRLSFDALYGRNDARLAGTDESYRFAVGGEFRLADGTYLELATGVNVPGAGAARLLTLGSIKYALRRDRRFAIP